MEFRTFYPFTRTESWERQEILRNEYKYDNVKKLEKLKIFFAVMKAHGEIPLVYQGAQQIGGTFSGKRIGIVGMSYPDCVPPPTRQRHFTLTENLFEFLEYHEESSIDALIAEQKRGASAGEALVRVDDLLKQGTSVEDLLQITSYRPAVKRRI